MHAYPLYDVCISLPLFVWKEPGLDYHGERPLNSWDGLGHYDLHSFSRDFVQRMKRSLLLFLLVSLALAAIPDDDDVLVFTDGNYEELMKEYNPVLVFFQTPVIVPSSDSFLVVPPVPRCA